MIAGEPGGLVNNVLPQLGLRAKRAKILPNPAVQSLDTVKATLVTEPVHADRTRWLVYLGTFLTAASVLELEVAWTRILSVMSWHHFTYMIISIAILGFGSAGSYLAFKGPQARHSFGALSRYAFAYSLSIVVSLLLVTRIEFDALLITKDFTELLKLLLIECLLATPFFFAGLTLSHIVTRFQEDIHRVYFSDLVGASGGCLVSVAAIQTIGATNAVFLAAVLAGAVGLLFQGVESGLRRPMAWVLFGLSVVVLLVGVWKNPYLVYPTARKGTSAFANRAQGPWAIEDSHWHVLARIDVSAARTGRVPAFASNVSPRRSDCQWDWRFVMQDGSAPTWMLRSDGDADWDIKKMEFLDGYLQGAPYVIQKAPRVLVIGVGGGIDVLIGLYNGAKHVVGVEVNSYMVRAIKEKWADFTGNIFNRLDVEIVTNEGRHFLSRNKDSFDVIQLSGVDTWAAALAGGHVATETYLYTVEGVMAAMAHLTPTGVLSYSRFVLDPPGETLRLAGVMAEGLRRRGVANPALQVVIVKGPLWADTLVKNCPFTAEEVGALRTWAKENGFAVLFDPFGQNDHRYDLVLRGRPDLVERFYRESSFDLSPPTDDRPFFFNYEKWRNFVTELKAERIFPAPSAIFPMVCALGLSMLLATLGILLPMCRHRVAEVPGRWISFVYFGSLGLGFIFVEIALIQKLMVFLGGPTYSLAFTLFVILFFSGLGSYFGRRWKALEALTLLAILIPAVIVLMSLLLSAAIPHLLGLALPWRIMIGILVISPVAFLIGMPFPLGLKIVGRLSPDSVPWAWAINSFTTVLGTLLAVLLSMQFGFHRVFLLAAFLYLLALLVMRQLARRAAAAQQ
jgi:hypothetical protein